MCPLSLFYGTLDETLFGIAYCQNINATHKHTQWSKCHLNSICIVQTESETITNRKREWDRPDQMDSLESAQTTCNCDWIQLPLIVIMVWCFGRLRNQTNIYLAFGSSLFRHRVCVCVHVICYCIHFTRLIHAYFFSCLNVIKLAYFLINELHQPSFHASA